jgi:hypothetical protein
MRRRRQWSAPDGGLLVPAWSKGCIMNEWAHELMLVISTISSVLAGITALVGEMRMRRLDRVVAAAPEPRYAPTDASPLISPAGVNALGDAHLRQIALKHGYMVSPDDGADIAIRPDQHPVAWGEPIGVAEVAAIIH